jgi:hypothetical protein
VRPTVVVTTTTEVKGKGFGRHFCGASLKAKAQRMSNAFRHALGLPVIEMGDHVTFKGEVPSDAAPITGEVRILPMPFIGAPMTPNAAVGPSQGGHSGDVKDDGVLRLYFPGDGPPRRLMHDPKHQKHYRGGSFLKRIHRAIMALGPWEGRAVAFVLGKCFTFITEILLICLERLWHRCFAPHVLGYVCSRVSHHQR